MSAVYLVSINGGCLYLGNLKWSAHYVFDYAKINGKAGDIIRLEINGSLLVKQDVVSSFSASRRD